METQGLGSCVRRPQGWNSGCKEYGKGAQTDLCNYRMTSDTTHEELPWQGCWDEWTKGKNGRAEDSSLQGSAEKEVQNPTKKACLARFFCINS